MTTPRISTTTILLVVLGVVLSTLAALVAAVLLKFAGATLVQTMFGGAGSFAGTLTLYFLVVKFLRSDGNPTS